jgi:tetraacyldisaccharide 4'-kinase
MPLHAPLSSLAHRLEGRWRAGGLKPLTIPLSWFYAAGVAVRNKLYDWKILKAHPTDVPVISVGNVAVGGTGKTPLVLWLARELSQGRRVAVVSRGYRGEVEVEKKPVVVSRGEGPLHSWTHVGDEPYLLASELPGVIVIAGPDRVAGVTLARELGAEVVILDDGMQHRRLARDVEIVVDDGEPGHLFPRGRLREPKSGLKRADLVVTPDYRAICEVDLKGKRVGLFCAIARPERFCETVRDLGAEVVIEQALPDHQPIDVEALTRFALRAKAVGASSLVCTTKDWIKLPLALDLALPLHRIERELVPPAGFLQSVKNLLQPST